MKASEQIAFAIGVDPNAFWMLAPRQAVAMQRGYVQDLKLRNPYYSEPDDPGVEKMSQEDLDRIVSKARDHWGIEEAAA